MVLACESNPFGACAYFRCSILWQNIQRPCQAHPYARQNIRLQNGRCACFIGHLQNAAVSPSEREKRHKNEPYSCGRSKGTCKHLNDRIHDSLKERVNLTKSPTIGHKYRMCPRVADTSLDDTHDSTAETSRSRGPTCVPKSYQPRSQLLDKNPQVSVPEPRAILHRPQSVGQVPSDWRHIDFKRHRQPEGTTNGW